MLDRKLEDWKLEDLLHSRIVEKVCSPASGISGCSGERTRTRALHSSYVSTPVLNVRPC